MIVSFSVENWMSFRDRATLSMVATRERQHAERLARPEKYQMRVLPAMALYGGNASGKTNLFKALAFVKALIVNATQPDSRIPVIPFLLDTECVKQPSRFDLELLIDEVVYALTFSVTSDTVLEERLVRIGSSTERTLYHRHHGQCEFDPSLDEEPQFLNFAFRGTRDNQLFLTNSVSQNVQQFRPVYDWFKDRLRMIAPDSRFQAGELFFLQDHPATVNMNEMLRVLDTGITQLGSRQVPFESIPIPESAKSKIEELTGEGEVVSVRDSVNTYLVVRKKDDLIALKRVTAHRRTDGTEATFDVAQESDGSQRLIDLLPAFHDLSAGQSKSVYVIDEMDRSLHTLLTRRLLEDYLASCTAGSRTQLLLTTHDVLLMDQRWLRRDEMWVTERAAHGASGLFSFSEYRDVRYDKDIRKSYLQGRLGGIPRITPAGSMQIGTEET